MKKFKVLGSGCRNCDKTANVIAQAAKEADIEIALEKVTDMAVILGHGVSATPENVSRCRHDRFPHLWSAPRARGDSERAARDFHGNPA
jgi:hypothetical protein